MSSPQLMVLTDSRLFLLAVRERLAPRGVRVLAHRPWVPLNLTHADMLVIDSEGQNPVEPMWVQRQLGESDLDIPIVVVSSVSAGLLRKFPIKFEFVTPTNDWLQELEELVSHRFQLKPRDRKPFQRPGPLPMHGRVVCIDPDLKTTQRLRVELSRLGLLQHVERSAPRGFRAAVKLETDLVITEFHLQKGLGNWVLGRIRDCGFSTPVIFLANIPLDLQSPFREQMLEMGAHEVLFKPMNSDALRESVTRAIWKTKPQLPAQKIGSETKFAGDAPHQLKPHLPALRSGKHRGKGGRLPAEIEKRE